MDLIPSLLYDFSLLLSRAPAELAYVVLWACACLYTWRMVASRSRAGHGVLGGNTHRLFTLPEDVRSALDEVAAVLPPNRLLELLHIGLEVDGDASDMESHFLAQGLSAETAGIAATSLKTWFDHCCGLAGTPAGIIKLHTSTTAGPRWHTDLNCGWLSRLGGDQPQFKFGCTVRGDGTLLLDLHPTINRLFQRLELIVGRRCAPWFAKMVLNRVKWFGRAHACPTGNMVAWSICHGANAGGLRQVHSEALSSKTKDGRNRVFVQVLPCTLENARLFDRKNLRG